MAKVIPVRERDKNTQKRKNSKRYRIINSGSMSKNGTDVGRSVS